MRDNKIEFLWFVLLVLFTFVYVKLLNGCLSFGLQLSWRLNFYGQNSRTFFRLFTVEDKYLKLSRPFGKR